MAAAKERKIKEDIQPEMAFSETGNRFRENMERGNFTVLFEISSPQLKDNLDPHINHLKSMEYAVTSSSSKIETGIAVGDGPSGESWHPADFAENLSHNERNRHVLFVSGRNSDMKKISESVRKCRASGFANLVAVTGNLPDKKSEDGRHRRIHYTESLHILSEIQSSENKDGRIFPGAVVNPHKYTPSALYPQYCKLMKKIRRGANFIVCQAGWDMEKLQETKWYLEMRDSHVSLISRILFLTPEMAENIFHGGMPGIFISHDLNVVLRKESTFGYPQFAASQWRRIQFQAAGARLLGCSGVLISGVERPEHISAVCSKISEALDEFKDFGEWKDSYLNYLARADMTPYPHRFYIFKNIFTRQHPDLKVISPVPPEKCTRTEKIKYSLSNLLFKKANLKYSGENYLAKKILAGCRGCSYCRLPLMHYICPESCPKGISNGPCGGNIPDGTCENGRQECIHSKRFRIASWKKDIHTVEDRFIRPLEVI